MFKVQITYPESCTENTIETDTAITMNTPAVTEDDTMLYGTMKQYIDRVTNLKESLDIIEDITKKYSGEKVAKLFDSIVDDDMLNDIFSYIYNRINSQCESELYIAVNMIKTITASMIDIKNIDKGATEEEEPITEEKAEEVVEEPKKEVKKK